MSSANGRPDPDKRIDNDSCYALTFHFQVAEGVFEYSRQLSKAWIRKKLPVRSLSVRAIATGGVLVVAVVNAPSSRVAISEWVDFPLQAMSERHLDVPDCLSLSVRRV